MGVLDHNAALRYKVSVHPLLRVRALALVLITGLVVSGLTAIPLQDELDLLDVFPTDQPFGRWIHTVHLALIAQNQNAPFLGLGTDWLAFGHVVIGLGFIGLLIDPVRNEWLVTWGLLICALLLPWAWGFGALRGIPWGWRLIDCSFGVGALIVLLLIRREVNVLSRGIVLKHY